MSEEESQGEEEEVQSRCEEEEVQGSPGNYGSSPAYPKYSSTPEKHGPVTAYRSPDQKWIDIGDMSTDEEAKERSSPTSGEENPKQSYTEGASYAWDATSVVEVPGSGEAELDDDVSEAASVESDDTTELHTSYVLPHREAVSVRDAQTQWKSAVQTKKIRSRAQVSRHARKRTACPYCKQHKVDVKVHIRVMHPDKVGEYETIKQLVEDMPQQKKRDHAEPVLSIGQAGICPLCEEDEPVKRARLVRHLARIHQVKKASERHRNLMDKGRKNLASQPSRKEDAEITPVGPQEVVDEVLKTVAHRPKGASGTGKGKGKRVVGPRRAQVQAPIPANTDSDTDMGEGDEDSESSYHPSQSESEEESLEENQPKRTRLQPITELADRLLRKFRDHLVGFSGGRLTNVTSAQYPFQVRVIWTKISRDFDPQAFADPEIIRERWLEDFTGTHKPGTVRSYICSLRSFAKFLATMSLITKKAMQDVLLANDFWRRSLSKDTQKRHYEVHERDRVRLLSQDDVRRWEKLPQVTEAANLLSRVEVGQPAVKDEEFLNTRDYLMARLIFSSGQRAGAFRGMRVREVRERQARHGAFVISVLHHKTAHKGPAPITVATDLSQQLDAYIDCIRGPLQQRATGRALAPDDPVFCTQEATALTSSEFSNSLTRRYKINLTATLTRKAVQTRAPPEQREDVARAMSHSLNTARYSYHVDDTVDTAARMAKTISTVIRGQDPETEAM